MNTLEKYGNMFSPCRCSCWQGFFRSQQSLPRQSYVIFPWASLAYLIHNFVPVLLFLHQAHQDLPSYQPCAIPRLVAVRECFASDRHHYERSVGKGWEGRQWEVLRSPRWLEELCQCGDCLMVCHISLMQCFSLLNVTSYPGHLPLQSMSSTSSFCVGAQQGQV